MAAPIKQAKATAATAGPAGAPPLLVVLDATMAWRWAVSGSLPGTAEIGRIDEIPAVGTQTGDEGIGRTSWRRPTEGGGVGGHGQVGVPTWPGGHGEDIVGFATAPR